jgi:glycosyltransferase involved in cell wall biosynthesis
MPAYNASAYIAESIESVLIQNYGNFELIIVDDGSTDNTAEIIAAFNDPKIRYFYQANSGASSARNFAIKQARGQYLVLLDADDMITPDFIARHLQEFEKNTNADLIYSDYCFIDDNSRPIRIVKRPEYTDEKLLIRDLFRCGFPIVQFNHTCLRKSVFDRIGFYEEKLVIAEDYDMIRRFLKCGLKLRHIGQVLYLRRITTGSLSRSFTPEKANCHFEVVRRFTETFSPEELFPDIDWSSIAPDVRPLHAKCMAAVTCLSIGQAYVRNNVPLFAATAFELACSQLDDCLKADPQNWQVRQLLQKCRSARSTYSETPQQNVALAT